MPPPGHRLVSREAASVIEHFGTHVRLLAARPLPLDDRSIRAELWLVNAAFRECDKLTHAVGGSGRAANHCGFHAGKGVHRSGLRDELLVEARGTAIPW